MAKFNTGQSFADGDQVTGAKLNNIVGLLDIYSGVIADQTAIAATVSTADLLLIADTDAGSSGAANKVTIQKLLNDTLTGGTFTNANIAEQLTYGTATGNRTISTSATITTGTITGLNTTTGTINTLNSTTGTVATLNSATGTITGLSSTNGTIATLNSTTGTIPTLTSITKITSGTGTAAAPAISPTGDTNTGIFFPAADTIAFAEGGAEAMRIDSIGNVGIGTDSPATYMSAYSGSANGIVIADSGIPSIIFADTASTTYSIISQNGTDFDLFSNAAGSTNFYTNSTERLRIASAGQIGIGGANYGTSGQVLTSAGASAAPSWSNVTIGTNSITFPMLSTSTTEADNVAKRTSKAWVNFDGTTNVGGNCTIRDDFNVSTVADNGTGDYTVNFTTAMSNANYCVASTGKYIENAGASTVLGVSIANFASNPAAGSVRVVSGYANNGGQFDFVTVCVSILS